MERSQAGYLNMPGLSFNLQHQVLGRKNHKNLYGGVWKGHRFDVKNT